MTTSQVPVKTLYICYFGLREPLVQTQVLPYLREFRLAGIHVTLLTFEPHKKASWTPAMLEEWRNTLRLQGIEWTALAYHKRPTLPATLLDIMVGAYTTWRLVTQGHINVLHARGHVPCVMAALVKRLIPRCRIVFDIRGFMPEEYVDAGRWPADGFLFRLAKRAERWLMAASDGFVVLTEKARDILFAPGVDRDDRGRPLEVIPCCIDPDRFATGNAETRTQLRTRFGIGEERRVIVYVGTQGGWYMTEEMADFLAFAHAKNPNFFALILTQSAGTTFADALRKRGLSNNDFLVTYVDPGQVPDWLEAADLALSFIRPCFSKLSSSPTKIAEYLVSGLPVITTAGIGDVDDVIQGDQVGVLVHDFTPQSFERTLSTADALSSDPAIKSRCRASARARFDLKTVGGPRYRRLYARLLQVPPRFTFPAATSDDRDATGG